MRGFCDSHIVPPLSSAGIQNHLSRMFSLQMIRFIFRRRPLKTVLVIGLAVSTVSCGTILHPERRGQPAGRLDPAIVALDAVGLLIFFVPGVIAFAVDFNNGTIYLPPEEYSESLPQSQRETDLTVIPVESEELTAQKIQDVIQQQTGKTITLAPGTYQVRKLQNADQIAALLENGSEEHLASRPTAVVFRCQSD